MWIAASPYFPKLKIVKSHIAIHSVSGWSPELKCGGKKTSTIPGGWPGIMRIGSLSPIEVITNSQSSCATEAHITVRVPGIASGLRLSECYFYTVLAIT